MPWPPFLHLGEQQSCEVVAFEFNLEFIRVSAWEVFVRPHVVHLVLFPCIQSGNFLEIKFLCFGGVQNVKHKDVKASDRGTSVVLGGMGFVPKTSKCKCG